MKENLGSSHKHFPADLKADTCTTWYCCLSLSLELVFYLFLFNPFTATMSLEMGSENAKFETLKHFFFSLASERKGLSPKRIALNLDAIGPENILFAGASVHLSARKFYILGQ